MDKLSSNIKNPIFSHTTGYLMAEKYIQETKDLVDNIIGQNNDLTKLQFIRLLEIEIQETECMISELEREINKIEKENSIIRIKLHIRWKNKEISATEFLEESGELEKNKNEIYHKKLELESEYRLLIIESLNKISVKDEKIIFVKNLNLKENIDDYIGSNILEGGSNTQGVFEIKGTDLLAIVKSIKSYENEGNLIYYTSLFNDNPCIPRILQVFIKNGKTYKIIENARGIQLDKLSIKELEDIPQKHYFQLIDTIVKMGKKGVLVNTSKPSNFFYDKEIGFVFIDLSSGNFDFKNLEKNVLSFLTHGNSNIIIENKIINIIKKYIF